MPLSEHTTARTLSHTRNIAISGYAREDGLWDIEAEIRDIKSYDIANKDRGGVIKTGEPLHNMWVRLTIDEDLLIHEAEAVTDASPFNICVNITDTYKQLVGLRIAPGWNRQVKRLFGGVAGCIHITELLAVMATVSFQTIYGDKMRRLREGEAKGEEVSSKVPQPMDTCYALAAGGEKIASEYNGEYNGEGD